MRHFAIKQAVIPCAGYGTRWLPLTKVVPKELLPLGSRPAIHYLVEEALEAGVREVIFVCHPSETRVADYFRPDKELEKFLTRKGKKELLYQLQKGCPRVRIQVVYQKQPLGLGHAIGCARRVTRGPFLVLLPDDLVFPSESASKQLLKVVIQKGRWGILLERVPWKRVSDYGVIVGDEIEPGVFSIRGAVEKPQPRLAPTNLAIVGRYILPPEIHSLIGKTGVGAISEIQLTDAINQLAKKTPGIGVVCRGKRLDIGTPAGLFKAWEYHRRQLD